MTATLAERQFTFVPVDDAISWALQINFPSNNNYYYYITQVVTTTAILQDICTKETGGPSILRVHKGQVQKLTRYSAPAAAPVTEQS